MNILANILEKKREEVALRKRQRPVSELTAAPEYDRTCFSLHDALKGDDLSVIAEIKKASPSKGVIRENFDPVKIAREYVEAGANALSVLTVEQFFQGKLEFITKIRAPIPVLRKDFIIDPYQVHEAKSAGADAILLIVAALDPSRLRDLYSLAVSIGLECLVEVHSADEIAALDLSQVRCIGINNRDLTTFATDINVSAALRSHIPASITVVSESGIGNGEDIAFLAGHGIHAVLVGEAFMRAASPGEALRQFLLERQA